MIRGEEIILEIKSQSDTQFRLVTCLTSSPFSESSDTIPTTTRDNNGWKTQLATNQSYTIEINGVMVRDGADGNGFYSYNELRKLKRNREIFEWRMVQENGYSIDEGRGNIFEISRSDEAGEYVTFSATITGFGAPTERDERVRVLGTPDSEGIYIYNNNNAIKA